MFKKCQVCVNCGRCQGAVDHEKKMQMTSTSYIQWENVTGPITGNKKLVAIDIGTTTIVMNLYDRDGKCEDRYACVNPQRQYGADVLSRIQAAEEKGKAAHMKRLVLGELQKGIERFQNRIKDGEELVAFLAGNTTMIYLLMGWNPVELGQAPFCANHLEQVLEEITTYHIPCHIFPGVSAFVGGDIVAGVRALGFEEKEELTLLVDLGTNGEIVLGNKYRKIACATAAGPAFEGGASQGIFGANMVSYMATLRKMEILDETGALRDSYLENGIRIGNLTITKEMVRQFQSAKAAIVTGIEIMQEKYQVKYEDISQVVLAGGFGYFLNPADAVMVGLLPKALETKAIAGGNTALAGATVLGMKYLSQSQERLPDLSISNVEAFNLAKEECFEAHYLKNMQLNLID